MKYLNEESQFTRISDVHAKGIMESLGYEIPSKAVTDVYQVDDRRFSLVAEVVEAEDGLLYARLAELDETYVIHVDESGRESLLESVSYEDEDYLLEGLYEDGEGGLFVRLVSENVDPGDEEAADAEEDAEDEVPAEAYVEEE